MEHVRVIAVMKAKAGEEGRVQTAMGALVGQSRKEPGNISYSMNVDMKDPALFVIIEHWEGEEVRQKHLRSDHFKAFAQTVDGEKRLVEHTFQVLRPL